MYDGTLGHPSSEKTFPKGLRRRSECLGNVTEISFKERKRTSLRGYPNSRTVFIECSSLVKKVSHKPVSCKWWSVNDSVQDGG